MIKKSTLQWDIKLISNQIVEEKFYKSDYKFTQNSLINLKKVMDLFFGVEMMYMMVKIVFYVDD